MDVLHLPDPQHVIAGRMYVGHLADQVCERPLEQRQAMIDPEPQLLGDRILDATIGGVGEYLARRWKLTIPPWTEQPERFLKEPYFPTPLEHLKPLLIAQRPLAFRRRMIFVEHEPLRRARMPLR